ncbi:MAG: polysaccharide pyruvyl transferase family protein [Lachnospiraceae bacterium]|nr:polysaccharide pyruvyl transferase family protein [Lachnospiraceae bacterium]
MRTDNEGFDIPVIDYSLCDDCGRCFSSCPEVNPFERKERYNKRGECFAVMAEDYVRRVSSSGGAFSIISNWFFEKNGIVYGAAFDENYLAVHHIRITDSNEMYMLRGSKYIQSDNGDIYKHVKKDLDDNKYVLYTGVPCQIMGLYFFLGRDYPNLYTADLICHGANSKKSYSKYLEHICDGRSISKVEFRNKERYGWKANVHIEFVDGTEYWEDPDKSKSPFYLAFLKGISIRRSCYECAYTQIERCGDFTIGDFWKIGKLNKELSDKKGTSLVLVNNKKAMDIMPDLKMSAKKWEKIYSDYYFYNHYNGCLIRPTKEHPGRAAFWGDLEKTSYDAALSNALKAPVRYDVGLYGIDFKDNGSVMAAYSLARCLEKRRMRTIILLSEEGYYEESSNLFIRDYLTFSRRRKVEELHEVNKFCNNIITTDKNTYYEKMTFVDGGKGVALYDDEWCPAILLCDLKEWESLVDHSKMVGNEEIKTSIISEKRYYNDALSLVNATSCSDGVVVNSLCGFLIALIFKTSKIIACLKHDEKIRAEKVIKRLSIKNIVFGSDFDEIDLANAAEVDYSYMDTELKKWREESIRKLLVALRSRNIKRITPYDVGIVGYWWSENYGSVATYYAVYKTIKKLGYIPVLLDNRDKKAQKSFARSFMNYYCHVISRENHMEYNALCHAFLIGSDQVWSPGSIAAYDKFFFLDFVVDKNRLAFASSFGENINICKEQKLEVKKLLNKFDAVSVREKSARDILNEEFEIRSQWIADPVFTLDRSEWELLSNNSMISVKDVLGNNKKYIFSYILDPTPEKRSIIQYISEIKHMPVINIVHAKESDRKANIQKLNLPYSLEDVNEEEWLYFLNRSEYIITDSYHGTCFSIIFNKQFLNCTTKSWGWTRYDSLINLFGIEDCFAESIDDLIENDTLLNSSIDYSLVDETIKLQRALSVSWLKQELQKC